MNDTHKKVLSNLFELSSNVKIYVPSTIDVDQETDNQAMVEHVETVLAGYFGGATAMQALGSWLAQNGKLVFEKVTVVQSYCTEEQLNSHIEDVVNLALYVKKEMSQEAVSLEVNNKLYLV